MSEQRQEPIAVTLEIEWEFPSDRFTFYANHMLVQVTQDECFLNFYEVPPPELPLDPKARAEVVKANPVQKVKAKFVAKIAIPLSRVERFSKAFGTAVPMSGEIEKAILERALEAAKATKEKEGEKHG